MNNMTILKASGNEQIQNSRLLNSFLHAFIANDVNAIKGMLHNEGFYFGKYSKSKAAGYFYSIFFNEKSGIHHLFDINVNKGIALNKIPGSEVLEIRCCHKINEKSKFGSLEDIFIGERVFRYCFLFKDSKILDIQIPTRFIEKAEELKAFN
jgi:hypothetical protein